MKHCWKDYRTHLEETGQMYTEEWANTYHDGNKTCMLERGHAVDHDFVDDSSIVIKFSGDEVPRDH